MKDGGPFSTLSPMDRIALADRFQDIGEYLSTLLYAGRLDTRFHPIHEKMAYFAPCHQREQKIGTPYMDLLSKIPGLTLQIVGGAMDCCGMGGALGFKKDFYGDSVSIGSPHRCQNPGVDPGSGGNGLLELPAAISTSAGLPGVPSPGNPYASICPIGSADRFSPPIKIPDC